MVKKSLKTAAVLAAAALLSLLALVAWLIGTTAGAEWLLGQIAARGGVRLEARVDGTLRRGLELHDLNAAWESGQLTIDRFALEMEPLALLRLDLSVQRLDIGAVSVVQTRSPETSSGTAQDWDLQELWTSLRSGLAVVDGDVRSISVDRIRFGHEGEPYREVTGFSSSLHWTENELEVAGLALQVSGFGIEANVRLDSEGRTAQVEIVCRGATGIADWDTLRARLDMDAAFSGPLHVGILSGTAPRITVQADASLFASGVDLEHVVMTRSGGPDRVSGDLQVAWNEPLRVNGALDLRRLNLAAEAGWPTDLNGTVQAELDAGAYRGVVDLANARPGLEKGRVKAMLEGDWQGLVLSDLEADWLDGHLTGGVRMDWVERFRMSATVEGAGLDSALLVPQMPGRLNFLAAGRLEVVPEEGISATWHAEMADSRLLGRPLSGLLSGTWENHDLVIDAMDLHSEAMSLTGQGRLSRRIDLQLQVGDLSQVGQGWSGELSADGWLSRGGNDWQGAVQAETPGLALGRYRVESGEVALDYAGRNGDSRIAVTLQRPGVQDVVFEQVRIDGSGRLRDHRIDLAVAWPKGTVRAMLSGGWTGEDWRGRMLEMTAREDLAGDWTLEQPAELVIGRRDLQLPSLYLSGGEDRDLELTAEIGWRPFTGSVQAQWHDFPLQTLNPWIPDGSVSGAMSGTLDFTVPETGAVDVAVELTAVPSYRRDGLELSFAATRVTATWDRQGLNTVGVLTDSRGGRIDVALLSPEPANHGLPNRGEFSLSWQDVAVETISPLLPPGIAVTGGWQGDVRGRWQDGKFSLVQGRTWIVDGQLQARGADGMITAPMSRAELTAQLESGWVDGTLDVALAGQGTLDARFRLPATRPKTSLPVDARLRFELRELGLLNSLLAGVANETAGALRGDVRIGGTTDGLQLYGTGSLTGASAEVPALGLRLEDAGLEVAFDGSTARIERLELSSGTGNLTGSGEIRLSGWRPDRWTLSLKGEQLQVVNLPGLSAEANPDMTLSGVGDHLVIKGSLAIPSLLATDVPGRGAVEPSEDVVVVGAEAKGNGKYFEDIEIDLLVSLGDHVVLKVRGLDARIDGRVRVTTDTRGMLAGQGMIRVVEGHYAAYGLKLPITRGQASFGGGSLQDPALDILAERTVDDVKAGVQVTGTPRKPQVRLVSTPALPDTEILSYIVLGRPLGAEGGENDRLMLAARALLSQGESAALQEKIKRQIGIDVIEVETGGEGGLSESMISVGKYLTPELYLSFGRSLFTPESVAKLRYEFGEHWGVESQFGETSGADLFYRIEFR